MDYDEIKEVFSIWICMNMKENSTDYVHLVRDRLLGALLSVELPAVKKFKIMEEEYNIKIDDRM